MFDHLIYGQLRNDPQFSQAKKLLLEVLEEKQKKITGIKPPLESLKISYEEMIRAFSSVRGTPLFFPYLGSGIGNGPFVELMDGSIKYDFISGIGVHFFGHGYKDIVLAGIDAALSNTVMQGPLQQNIDSLELMSLLKETSGLDCCFLTSSGAMANENALKLLFQKNYPRSRILAFNRSFSGRTLALSQITDKAEYRKGLPKTIDVDYIPFYDENDPGKSLEISKRALLTHLKRYPGQHAAMIFELVQGEGGFYPGNTAFFKQIMEILKEHEILVFIDEIQTFGRLYQLFAFQHFDLAEFVDVVSIGKLSQVCATLFRKKLTPQKGLISQTFSSSTASIKAANVIIKSLLEGGFYGPNGKIAHFEKHFHSRLKSLQKNRPDLISGPFGIGGMVAFTAFKGDRDKTIAFLKQLFEKGVLSFFCGDNPTRVRLLLPAGAITVQDIDAVSEIIEKTLISN